MPPGQPQPSPTATGRAAESLAAAYLEQRGHRILDRNWRNRWCELDIVTKSHTAIHFIEVKYRRTTAYGAPAEYISRDKIGRLTRAASAWCQAHGYTGPYQIDIMSVTGPLERPAIEIIESATQA